jgi:hypothetical protein
MKLLEADERELLRAHQGMQMPKEGVLYQSIMMGILDRRSSRSGRY